MIINFVPAVLLALVAALLTISTGHALQVEGPPLATGGRASSTDLVQIARSTPNGASGSAPTSAQIAQPATVEEFLALLGDAGFDEIPVLELAVSRDWIPSAFSPHYLVGGATLEIFELQSPAQVETALGSYPGADGSDVPPQDEVVWGAGSLVIVLFDASNQSEVEGIVNQLVGPPAIRVAARLTPGDVLQHLTRADFTVPPVVMNAAQEWIPVTGTGSPVNTTHVEIYELESVADVEAALRGLDDVATGPPANATIWGSGQLIVILFEAPENPLLEESLSGLLGDPRVATIAGSPPPPPPTGGPGEGAPLVATSVEALADALRSGGLDVLVTGTAVTQAWIPESGYHLVVDGAGVDVFVLSSRDAVSNATATRKNGPLSDQPPANVAVWLNGTAFIILSDAPEHPEVSEAISALIGPPQFSTSVGSQPPPPPPSVLPSTGSGGQAGATAGDPYLTWLGFAGSVLLLTALGYGIKSGWRRQFGSH